MPPRRVWKINERSGPSPRAYLSLVDRWSSKLDKWVASAYKETKRKWELMRRDEELNELEARDFAYQFLTELQNREGKPVPPTAEEIEKAGAPLAKSAVKGEVKQLKKLGANERVWQRLLPGLKPGQVNAIDIYNIAGGRDALLGWANDGAAYINSLDQAFIPELSIRVLETAASGARWESLAESVLSMGAKNTAHARLIAQDQVGKLNGKISETLQKQAGGRQFRWRATRDSRTRPTHAAADGQVFDWDVGAPNVGFYGESGLPGQCGRCRCVAEFIAPEWWNDL